MPDLHLTGAPTTKETCWFCLPPPLSSILHLVKARRKIQAGWQEEIKLRKEERAPFILLDLNSHTFPLFLLQMSHQESDPITRQKREEMKGENERTRQREVSYCSPTVLH